MLEIQRPVPKGPVPYDIAYSFGLREVFPFPFFFFLSESDKLSNVAMMLNLKFFYANTYIFSNGFY